MLPFFISLSLSLFLSSSCILCDLAGFPSGECMQIWDGGDSRDGGRRTEDWAAKQTSEVVLAKVVFFLFSPSYSAAHRYGTAKRRVGR